MIGFRLTFLIACVASVLVSQVTHAEFISSAVAVATGGVDEEQTDTSVGSTSATAKVQSTSPRDTGNMTILAHAGDGKVGASVEFSLHTESFQTAGNPNHNLAQAGGSAQAEFADTVYISLIPYIGNPGAVGLMNLSKITMIVEEHAKFSTSATGYGFVNNPELEFSMLWGEHGNWQFDIYGASDLRDEHGLPIDDFKETRRLLPVLVDGDSGTPENPIGKRILDIIGSGYEFPSQSLGLRVFTRLSGESRDDGSATGNLNANNTLKVLGIVFLDPNDNVIPLSPFASVRSASGTQYQILDSLPQIAPPAAVPEPASLTLVGTGAVGMAIGAICRRRQQKKAA